MSMIYLHSIDSLELSGTSLKQVLKNGRGPLYEATAVAVHEVLNGIFEIEFDYPANGDQEIVYGDIVTAIARPGSGYYPFIIDSISKPFNGIATYHGSHWSFLLSGVVVGPIEGNTASEVIGKMQRFQNDSDPGAIIDGQLQIFNSRRSAGTAISYPLNAIKITTDIPDSEGKPFKTDSPSSVRSLLGNEIEGGSLLDVYEDAEYAYDSLDSADPYINYIRLLQHRGTKKPIQVIYGRNLVDFDLDEDFSDVYTDIIPYYNSGDNFVLGNIVSTEKTYPITKFMAVDVTSDLDSQNVPTVEQVTQAGRDYFVKNKIDEHDVKLTVTTSNDDEFEGLDLGDIISIRYDIYNYSADLKCTEYYTDVINDRFTELKFDKAKPKDISSIVAQSSVSTGGEVSQSKKAQGDSGGKGSSGSGGAGLSNANPLMDGSVSPGSSTLASRSDHRHPSNITKLNVGAILSNQDIEDIMQS